MGAVEFYFQVAKAESEQVEEACRFLSSASIPSLQRLAERVHSSEDLVRRWVKVYPQEADTARPVLDLMEHTRQTLEGALWQLLSRMPPPSPPPIETGPHRRPNRQPRRWPDLPSRIEPGQAGESAALGAAHLSPKA